MDARSAAIHGFKLSTRDGCLQSDFVVMETELSVGVAGERDLGALHGLVELIAEIGLDQLREGCDLLRLEGADAGRAKHLADGAGAQE